MVNQFDHFLRRNIIIIGFQFFVDDHAYLPTVFSLLLSHVLETQNFFHERTFPKHLFLIIYMPWQRAK